MATARRSSILTTCVRRLSRPFGDRFGELTSSFASQGGLDGFEKAYKQCVKYSEGVLAELGYEKQGGKI